MNKPPVIRSASPDDVDQLSIMGSKAFLHAYGNAASKPDIERHVDTHFSPAAIATEMQQPDLQYFMAATNGECLGLLKLRDTATPVEVGVEKALKVEQLYVSSDHQRQGIGVLLMDQAIQVAHEQDADGIWLSVWSEAEGATAFYRRYGFTQQGTVPFYLGSTKQLDYVMWLPITPD